MIVRYGVSHLHHRRMGAVARLLKACIALDLGGALVGSAVAVVAILLLAPAFGWSDAIARDALLLSFVTLLAVRSTPIGILRLYDRYRIGALADTALPIVRFAGALVALLFAPALQGFLIAWAIAEIASAATFWSLAWRRVRKLPWRESRLSLRQLRAENEDILRLAGLTNASTTFQLVGQQAAVLLVGLFSSPAAAGGFRLAHQLGQAMARLSQLVSRALFPELVRAKELSADPLHFVDLLGRTIRLSAMTGVLILGLLFLAGKALLVLVAGEEFAAAYPLLLLLGGAAVFDLIGVTFEPTLVAIDRAGTVFRVKLLTMAAMLGTMIVLLSQFGAVGAGIALLAGSAMQCILLGIATYRAVWRHDPAVTATDAAKPDSAADADRPEAL